MMIFGAELTYSSYDISQRQSAKLFGRANSVVWVFLNYLQLKAISGHWISLSVTLFTSCFSTIQDLDMRLIKLLWSLSHTMSSKKSSLKTML